MLARLIAPAVFLTSTAFADCPPDPAVVEAIETVRDNPCYQLPECLDRQLEDIDRLLEERPGSIVLHRMRQDLRLAANADQLEVAHEELLDHYRNHPALEPDDRRYLVARMMRDESGLREAVEDFRWARLDLMQRRFEADGEALVEQDEARQLLEGFVAECPDAAVLLAAEARQLLISARWPVWGEVRRHLLDLEPPPWDRLGPLLIRSGLLQAGDAAPARRLLTELEAATGNMYRDAAGYWLYRARIHHQARDIDAALEANARARQIDPCRQLPPLQRIRPDEADELSANWMADVSEQVLACPPDLDTYKAWMIAVTQQPELIEDAPLARFRGAVEDRSLGQATESLERGLARIDICCTGHDPEAAWATLERLFEESLASLERTEPGTDRAWMAWSTASNALKYAKLALENDFPQRANQWRTSGDALLEEHQRTLRQQPRWERFMSHLDAVRRELDWLQARKEKRHADAVVHALSARADGLPWIEMDEVMASWRAAGGTEKGFEHLLAVWDLDLPAKWRGWRRLDEPLEAFELADQQSRTWTLADFEGKRTLLNLWAVWCGPCLLELPKVQELHERYRDDPDVQVVTVNMDSVEGVAREMMEREGYDFPVLMRSSNDTAFEQVAIPRNWLVDEKGMRQWEQTGFTPDVAEHWMADIVSLLEQMQ